MVPATTFIKAGIIKAAIDKVTGDSCILEPREKSIKILLTEKQKKWFQGFLEAQLEMKRQPDIEVDALGIIFPIIAKKLWPFAAAAGGGIAAVIFGKGKNHER